jgi:gas vesicle protein
MEEDSFMTYDYDRYEGEDRGGAFLMGLLAGTVLGAGLGMLFAPRPGSDLRHQISESAGRLQRAASDTYQQASERMNQVVDRGRDAYERARESAAQGVQEARRYTEGAAKSATETGGAGGYPPSTPGTGTGHTG